MLGLACAYEVFSCILNEYQSVRPLKISLFLWAGILLFILGVVVALKLPGGGSGPEQELMHQLDRTSRIVQAGLLLCVLFFSSYLGMDWKKPVFGIALGFGAYATLKLVVLTLALQFGATVNTFVNLVNVIAYLAASVIWLSFLCVPEPVNVPLRSPAPSDLSQWNQTLKGMSH